MTTTNSPTIIGQSIDPSDVIDLSFDFTKVMSDNEIISSFTLTPSLESVAAGITILNSAGRVQGLDSLKKQIVFWLNVSGNQTDQNYDNFGVNFRFGALVVTDQSRQFDRTIQINVRQL
jgi:hypothetical protein